jgi:hypothetical protein
MASIQNPYKYQTPRPSSNGGGSRPSPYNNNNNNNNNNLPPQQPATTLFDITTTREITQEETKDDSAYCDEFASLWVPADLAIQATKTAEQEYQSRHRRRRIVQTSTKQSVDTIPVPSLFAPATNNNLERNKARLPPLSSLNETESNNNAIGLTQMVEDDASEIQMSTEQSRLVASMLKMRTHLEAYVNKSLWVNNTNTSTSTSTTMNIRTSLHGKINTVAAQKQLPKDFVRAMHTIREYGNNAAHCRPLPNRSECERAVNEYLKLKESTGNCFKKRKR